MADQLAVVVTIPETPRPADAAAVSGIPSEIALLPWHSGADTAKATLPSSRRSSPARAESHASE